MQRDESDLIAVGRALISDPHRVEKVRADAAAAPRSFEASALAALV